VKEGRDSIGSSEISNDKSPIAFRSEQQEAIDRTINHFKKGNEMLWFAKMRFGKTLSALQVVRVMDYSKTLILTHRPVVDAGWFEDLERSFMTNPIFPMARKRMGT
jgi:superfamily II DNA or RNA helicase